LLVFFGRPRVRVVLVALIVLVFAAVRVLVHGFFALVGRVRGFALIRVRDFARGFALVGRVRGFALVGRVRGFALVVFTLVRGLALVAVTVVLDRLTLASLITLRASFFLMSLYRESFSIFSASAIFIRAISSPP